MKECFCCDEPLDGTPNDGTFHDSCHALFDERLSHGMCVYCGLNEHKPDGCLCNDCKYMARPHNGYPPA